MTKPDPDPGGHFASEGHRRVTAALPAPEGQGQPDGTPMAFEDVPARLLQCGLDVPPEVAQAFLNDLVASGDVERIEGDSYRVSPKGWEALNGPIADEPPPLEGAKLKRAEESDKEHAANEKKALKAAKEQRKTELREQLAALEEEN